MTQAGTTLKVYNIPAGIPFASALAAGLLEQGAAENIPLTRFRILLPTRRACRNLRDTFLNLGKGQPLLLPRLQPIGDVDEDELIIELAGQETAEQLLQLPPAISPLRRRVLLARHIMSLPDYTRGPDQDFALAGALGRLMDQVYTEGLDLKDLAGLVEEEQLARHWQITVKFLEILSKSWPAILKEHGVIDAADRRDRLLAALAETWKKNPPSYPVIAAGSTGSIPATGKLLHIIAGLPHGAVVLPGLDQGLDQESWEALDDTHPQATLKQLLGRMQIKRTDVHLWPCNHGTQSEPSSLTEKKRAARNWLATETMRPAATANCWQNLQLGKESRHNLNESLKQVMRFECDTAQDEARLIALLMRETLEEPERTAALITPDRTLARRVTMVCRRWGIGVDDSGGQPLSETPLGSFLRLVPQTFQTALRPGLLAALLKHRHCHLGIEKGALNRLTGRFESEVLRGPAPRGGFAGLRKRVEQAGSDSTLVDMLESISMPFLALMQNSAPFSEFLDEHIRLAEKIATRPDGSHTLWQDEEGEAAALFLADLREQAALMPHVTGEAYLDIIEQLMRTINIRPNYGIHPRIFVYGQLEARLIRADLVILGGLNEGTWPPDPGNDPWMSRPMREKFRLPALERSVGLAAHDFVQGFNAPHVALTRARRVDGAPAVPARWLQRLDTVLQALGIDPAIMEYTDYMHWQEIMDAPQGDTVPLSRPQPRPPVEKRPDSLYVTAIEKWMRDPYSIYARYILNLRKLPDLEEQADAAERGTMMHGILDKFVQAHPRALPSEPLQVLLDMGREDLVDRLEDPRLWGFWWPRFERLANWFVRHEQHWRLEATNSATESKGTVTLDIDGAPFTLSAKADRIDKRADGYAVIDYKTGSCPSAADVNNGYAPQLPLEAIIISEGGFAGLPADDVAYMGFWSLSGGIKPGEEKEVKADTEQARAGLLKLVRAFRDPQTPYYSLPRPAKAPPADWQDYAHLARVQEWTALDDAEDTA